MSSRLGKPRPRDVAINHHTRSNYIDLEPEEKLLQRYPSLDWTSDNFAMTYRLLETLEHDEQLRRTVCTRGRKSVTRMTKSDAYHEIAIRVLEVFPAYAIYVGDAAGDGAKHYGPCLRNKIFALLTQYKSVRECLGDTGTGLPADWEAGEAWNSVKPTCPYFLRLGALVGKHTNVGDRPIKKRKRKARGVDLTGSGEVARTRESGKPDDMEDDDDEEFEDGVSSDSTDFLPRRAQNVTAPRRFLVDPRPQNVDNPIAGSSLNSPSAVVNFSPTTRTGTNAHSPQNSVDNRRRFLVDPRPQNVDNPIAGSSLNSPSAVVNFSPTTRTGTNAHSPQNSVDNRTRATGNLKRKAVVGELGNGLSTVAKPAKERRSVREENVENSRGELCGGVRQGLGPDVWYDLRVAELQERQAKRKFGEKRAEREHQLQMRRLELLEKIIASPANHLPGANADDKKEKSVVVPPNTSRHGFGQPEEGTLEHGPENDEEAEIRDDDLDVLSGGGN
ncbi:hypothetical protein MMC29_003226 [Sticta canariensis]|nr:hypothetical protein [Sticta canariensis]